MCLLSLILVFLLSLNTIKCKNNYKKKDFYTYWPYFFSRLVKTHSFIVLSYDKSDPKFAIALHSVTCNTVCQLIFRQKLFHLSFLTNWHMTFLKIFFFNLWLISIFSFLSSGMWWFESFAKIQLWWSWDYIRLSNPFFFFFIII